MGAEDMKLTAKCDHRFRARNHGSNRPISDIHCGVVHCTGADSKALNTALYFQNSRDAGSTQEVSDNGETFCTLPPNVVPNGAPPLNRNGWHEEIEGPIYWKRLIWLLPKHRKRLRRSAYRLAKASKEFSFPLKFVHDPSKLPDNPADFHGVTYHYVVSAKWHESTHNDPGPGFPYRYFEGRARAFYKRYFK